jgi:hypothetical protein
MSSNDHNQYDDENDNQHDDDIYDDHAFEHNLASQLSLQSPLLTTKRKHTDSPDLYSFTIVGGQVVSIAETEDFGRVEVKTPSVNETYSVSGSEIIKTEFHTNGQELTRYTLNADGVYIKASKQWNPSGTSRSDVVQPQITEVLSYDATDMDDLVAVSVTQSALGGTGADRFVVRELGHLVIDDFDHTENDRLVFDTGLGLSSVEHLAHYVTAVRSVGDDLVIEFGQGVSIQIVGGLSRGIDASDVLVLS